MSELGFTLLADGPADVMLLPVLSWLLRTHTRPVFVPQFADHTRLGKTRSNLAARARSAIDLWPCDLLFIHRDAEREAREARLREIQSGLDDAGLPLPPWLPAIPVRMTEAWFLHDASAIRQAAGNPSGQVALDLPASRDLESLPDPKTELERRLVLATELSGRRRERFRVREAKLRVAELLTDFAPLRRLEAFQALEADVIQVAERRGWARRA